MSATFYRRVLINKKVIVPFFKTWMIQSTQFVVKRVISSNIGAFIAVAFHASQAEILVYVFTAVTNRNDMIDMESGGLLAFPYSAVFTALRRPQANCATLLR